MDGITEPVVLVLGHPIAGNPAQFALERSFRAMQLEFRVLSCDIPPDRIEGAISGADILGFQGLLLDRALASQLDQAESGGDCFYRESNAKSGWSRENATTCWLQRAIDAHFQSAQKPVERMLCIGATDSRFPTSIADHQSQTPIAWAPAETIENSELIAVTEEVDVHEWPAGEASQLVVDLTDDRNDIEHLRELGYSVLGADDIQVGILLSSIERWTGRRPSPEILTEAIEEYMAV